MTDHYSLGVERFAAATDARAALDEVYASRSKSPVEIASLNDRIRHNMAAARLHFEAAQVQALQDVRAEVERLFQALAAEPTPPGPPLQGGRSIPLRGL